MRTFFTWILLILIAIGVIYFGSPWWTVWNLERAAKAGDAHAVEQAVDFPAVRASLSPQLTAQLQQALDREKDKPHTFLDKLTMFVAPLFAGKAVDTLVTPEGVTYMIKTAKAPQWTNPFKRDHTIPAGQPSLDLMRTGYAGDDMDQFHAVVDNKILPGRALSLKMLRRGFMTWKVVGLELTTVPVSATSSSTTTTNTVTSNSTSP